MIQFRRNNSDSVVYQSPSAAAPSGCASPSPIRLLSPILSPPALASQLRTLSTSSLSARSPLRGWPRSLYPPTASPTHHPRAQPGDMLPRFGIPVYHMVIPNESSRLLVPPSPTPVVYHQTLSERLAGIVCAKEGKMVSESARTPFTILSSHAAPFLSPPPPDPSSSTRPTNRTTTINRRPPVLTMTPARAQGSNLHLNLYADRRTSALQSASTTSESDRGPAQAQAAASASASAFESAPPSVSAASDGKAPQASAAGFAERGSGADENENACVDEVFSVLQGTFIDEKILHCFEHIPTLTELALTSQTVGIATTVGITREPSVPCLLPALQVLKIDGKLDSLSMVESRMNARLAGVACLEVLAVNMELEPVFTARLLPMQARGLDLTLGDRSFLGKRRGLSHVDATLYILGGNNLFFSGFPLTRVFQLQGIAGGPVSTLGSQAPDMVEMPTSPT
ncbi:hypothetical protein DFH09DRAFT_1323307 [Mycena vulgaris]|nr:hypothetical protein DFH09DRAFT_1323307 [Mycena vulgaris]